MPGEGALVHEEQQQRERLVQACQRLWQRNMLASADGNLSIRLADGRILITPSGVSKAFIGSEDMALVSLTGEILAGKPSSERLMHLTVYQQVPEACAVVHAHPPHAIAWSVAQPELRELPAHCLSELILAAGSIPFVPYARPGTQEMGEVLKPFLPERRLMILSRHGGLAWGESLDEAVGGMERLEHTAQILWLSHTLGGLTKLPDEEVKALYAMRKKIGDRLL